MAPEDVARALRLRLAGELADDRATLVKLAGTVAKLRVGVGSQHEWLRVGALAFELERYYTAVEATLARILRTLDGDVPSGADWHHELLRAAAVPIEGLRPSLVPAPALHALRELLGFRRFARHGYDANLDGARLEERALDVEHAQLELERSLTVLATWLRRD